jgi:hypothetical protein
LQVGTAFASLPSMKKISTYPRKSDDAFVTKKMLLNVRDELIERMNSSHVELKTNISLTNDKLHSTKSDLQSEIQTSKVELKSDISDLRSEMYSMKAELKSDIAGLRSEMHSITSEIKSDIGTIKSNILEIRASAHRSEFLLEEQANRNKIVLDGIAYLIHRQDRLESEWVEFKK